MAKKKKTIVGLLLDKTGSMMSIQEEAVTSIREYIETLRKGAPKATVLLATFNGCEKMSVIRRGAAKSIEPISRDEYVPQCDTPLYDSMMAFIKDLEQYEKATTLIILVTMTDGYENASTEFTVANVKAKIEEKTAKGWEIVFLGADIDTHRVGAEIGTQTGSTLRFGKASIAETTKAVSKLAVTAALNDSYTAGNFFNQDVSMTDNDSD